MNELTNAFLSQQVDYKGFEDVIEKLIRNLLNEHQLKFHKIEGRTKEPNRLNEKIIKKADKYQTLQDITDIVGIRIITYFEDEIQQIAEVIRSEFIIDEVNSVDKTMLESDRFGYRSLHYVVSISSARAELTEYKKFKDFKAEIQIRSILQHAWAEIEHGIGYKGERTIPEVLKRDFYRVAALLETADKEFVNIRKSSEEYVKSVSTEIKNHPEKVEINSVSLKSFIINNPIVQKLDERIVNQVSAKLVNGDSIVEILVERLHSVEINDILTLEQLMNKNEDLIVNFAKAWIREASKLFHSGISIFYLCYIIVAQRDDRTLGHMFLYKNSRFTERDSDEIFKIYKKISAAM